MPVGTVDGVRVNDDSASSTVDFSIDPGASLLESTRATVRYLNLTGDRYLELMAHDKKVTDGTLRLVLLRQIGRAVITSEAASADIRASIEACC